MARFAELSESELTTISVEKDAENTNKVYFIKHISRVLAKKRTEGSRAFDMKS